jgi:hypothetical protein
MTQQKIFLWISIKEINQILSNLSLANIPEAIFQIKKFDFSVRLDFEISNKKEENEALLTGFQLDNFKKMIATATVINKRFGETFQYQMPLELGNKYYEGMLK